MKGFISRRGPDLQHASPDCETKSQQGRRRAASMAFLGFILVQSQISGLTPPAPANAAPNTRAAAASQNRPHHPDSWVQTWLGTPRWTATYSATPVRRDQRVRPRVADLPRGCPLRGSPRPAAPRPRDSTSSGAVTETTKPKTRLTYLPWTARRGRPGSDEAWPGCPRTGPNRGPYVARQVAITARVRPVGDARRETLIAALRPPDASSAAACRGSSAGGCDRAQRTDGGSAIRTVGEGRTPRRHRPSHLQ